MTHEGIFISLFVCFVMCVKEAFQVTTHKLYINLCIFAIGGK